MVVLKGDSLERNDSSFVKGGSLGRYGSSFKKGGSEESPESPLATCLEDETLENFL